VRVVFLTHNYPRFAGDLPGAFLHPLAVALGARGHDVRVVAPSDQGRNGREEVDGVPVRRVRYAKAERERYAYTGQMADAVRSPLGLMALAGMIRALRQGAQAELAGAPDASLKAPAPWSLPAAWSCMSGVSSMSEILGWPATARQFHPAFRACV
jgi:hypothetical protein